MNITKQNITRAQKGAIAPLQYGKDQKLSSTKLVSFAIGFVLVLCTLASEFVIASALSLIAFFVYCVFILWSKGEMLIKYFAFIFAVVANIAGCVVVEFSELSLAELATVSHFSGSLPLLILSRWVFLVTIFSLDSNIESDSLKKIGDSLKSRKKWITTLSAVMLVVSTLLFLQVAPIPSFSVRANSFFYAQEYGVTGLWEAISHVISYAMIIPAMAIRQGDKKIGIAAIAVYFLYLFWTGNKFTNFLVAASLILIVFYDVLVSKGRKLLKRVVIWCVVLIAALLAFSLLAYSMTSNNKPLEYFGARLAQQGQLWWGTYSIEPQTMHPDEFKNEITALFEQKEGAANNVGSRNGIYGIMYATAPQNIIDGKLATGSQYTEGGYAAAYYYFGSLGAICFSVLMGLLVAFFTNGLIRAVIRYSPITACVYARFLVISMTSLSMFLFTGFFDTLSILSYAYLIIVSLVYRRSTSSQVRRIVG